MIPQSLKDVLSNGESVNWLQTSAMLIFIALFLALLYKIFSKPKKYYDEEANAPLDDDISEDEYMNQPKN